MCLGYNVTSRNFLKENMDINLLVQRLQHGDSYTVQDGDNDPYQVNTPPTHLTIKAANVITTLHNQIQQSNQALFNMQRQLEELAQAYETLRNSSTTTTPSGTA
jgi:uncharacterized coiled-coil protein SlyX